jgi:PAS domain S-box-containing protein/putative nucleotidyltransferase with HDIG domain
MGEKTKIRANSSEPRRSKEKLRESEEKYRDLYENAPDGIYSLSPDGTILEVNNTLLRMMGYEKDEIVGKMKISGLLTDDGLKLFQNTFADLKRKGYVNNVEYELKRKNGTLLPVLINATATYDEKGNFLKCRSIVRDNSAKKEFEMKLIRASNEWRITFDSMPYGVILLDREFKIIKANQYISTLTGISNKELVGKKCYETVYKSNKPIEFYSQTEPGQTLTTETIEFYEPEVNKYFMVYSTPIPDERGLIKAFVHSLVDITESKEKEKTITQSRDAFLNMLKDLDYSYKELREIYQGLILSFVNTLDAKSPWTKGHSVRVTDYALMIAKGIGLSEYNIEVLNTAALLHDIGKIGTYDTVLDKPARLTEEEFALVKMHPGRGAEILSPIRQFGPILPVIRHHHERIDGRGYPDGLKDKEIPFLARIIHVADSYDSMTADRPYRSAPGKEYAISELKKYTGTQFDPDVVEAFLKVLDNLKGEHATT